MVKGSLFEKRAVQIQKEDSLSSKEKNLQKIWEKKNRKVMGEKQKHDAEIGRRD